MACGIFLDQQLNPCLLHWHVDSLPLSHELGFYVDDYSRGGSQATDTYLVVRLDGEKLLTAGGRVLGVTAVSDTLEDAIAAAYKKTEGVDFLGAYMRKDIGKRALLAKKG